MLLVNVHSVNDNRKSLGGITWSIVMGFSDSTCLLTLSLHLHLTKSNNYNKACLLKCIGGFFGFFFFEVNLTVL